jgi:hypothetical protein
MRKSTEVSTEAVLQVKKTVTKKRARATPSKKRAARPPRKSTKRVDVSNENAPDGESNPGSSNERSPTPTENGLLLYLTAHITPFGGSIDEHTVFSINTAEYLRGVVRLIHSDCPEIGNVGSFLESMHRAFLEVNEKS